MRLNALFLAPALILSLAAQVDQARMKKDLAYLAGPACQGRGTGEPGQKAAAAYIAKRMQENGLKPLKGKGMGGETPYHFTYALEKVSVDAAKSGFETPSGAFRLGEEAIALLPGSAEGEAVLIGYGIKSEELGWDDFAQADLKGKWAVVFQGQPIEGPFKDHPNHPAALPAAKMKAALDAGALGLITLQGLRAGDEDLRKPLARIMSFLGRPRLQAKGAGLPFRSTPSAQLFKEARAALGDRVDSIQQAIDGSGKPQPPASLGMWKYHLSLVKEPVTASNVAGIVPGADPKLKREFIVVSAHHDHLGSHDGKVYFGADDNGSGTSGILELARLVAHAKPKRTILFLSVSGEEHGLLGSAAFIAEPPVDLARIKADINLDMIGRGKDSELHVTPAKIEGAVTTLTLEARKAAGKRGIALGAGAEAYWQRSDHYNFVKKGIPSLFFFAGMHEDYHQTTDTVDKINFAKMARIVALSKDLLLAVANSAKPPQPIGKQIFDAWEWSTTTTGEEPRVSGF